MSQPMHDLTDDDRAELRRMADYHERSHHWEEWPELLRKAAQQTSGDRSALELIRSYLGWNRPDRWKLRTIRRVVDTALSDSTDDQQGRS